MHTVSPAAPTVAVLTDLAYTLTEKRPTIHFICSPDGTFVSVFTNRWRAIAEWKHLCTKHNRSYSLFQGTDYDADGTFRDQ
jgi:hypothetical protein